MTDLQRRRAEYLLNWGYYIYCQYCLGERNNIAYKPSRYSTYPLYDQLDNNELSFPEKFNLIINELHRNSTVELNNDFWYDLGDWINNNQPVIDECHGRKLFDAIKHTSCRYNYYLPAEILPILATLFERIVLRKAHPNDEAIELRSKNMYNGVISIIKGKVAVLPERPTYLRFESNGKLVHTTNKNWILVAQHRKFPKVFDEDASKLHIGFELEGAYPSKDAFQACCDELQANGFLDKDANMCYPTSDYLRGPYPVEWVFAPLTLEDGRVKWPKFMEILHRHSFQHTTEDNNAGLHIHLDLGFLTGRQWLLFNQKMCAIENKREYFGRISPNYAKWNNLEDTYDITNKLIPIGNPNPDGTVLCKEQIRLSGIDKFAAINYLHTASVEVRAYNAKKADDLLGTIEDLVTNFVMVCKQSAGVEGPLSA